MGIRLRLGAAAAATLVTTLLMAAPASAGTVCEQGTTAVFAAADVAVENGCAGPDGATEVNHLTVNVNASGAVVFTDSSPITDGDGAGGCTVSGNTATCPGTGYLFDLGDSNDSATVGNVPSSGQSTGGPGDDSLAGGPLADNLTGGPGNDTLTGGAGDDTLSGGLGADTLSGDTGHDTLSGDDGADTLDGGAGDDTVDGGPGNDIVGGGPGNDHVSGGAGDDHVSGGDGADVLDGDPTAGSCSGSAGNDTLNGDSGDDTLCAGDGPTAGPDADVIAGGDGFDHVYYPRIAPVVVSLDGAAGDGEAGENDNVLTDVEAVTGGAGDDTLTGNDGPNWLDGAGGSDVLNGMGGPDYLVDSGGDPGADTLNGGPGDDTLADAGGGPDTYNGGDGEDLLTAYAGRSTSVNISLDGIANDGGAGEGDNVATDVEDVEGGAGDDTITGSAADNELIGGAGADTISGGDGNDGLEGGSGADVLDGGPGRDLLSGGPGSDQLNSQGDGVTDRDSCGGGTDSVSADGRDDVAGDCENVSIAPPAPVTIDSIVVTRAGFVVVRITCPIVEKACGGVVIVKTVRRVAHRFISLGHLNYARLHGGDSRFIRAKIAPRDRLALRRARRVKVRAIVANTNGDTSVTTTTTKLATVTTRGLR